MVIIPTSPRIAVSKEIPRWWVEADSFVQCRHSAPSQPAMHASRPAYWAQHGDCLLKQHTNHHLI